MVTCIDCIRGNLDEGTPIGDDTTLAGVACYISRPTAANGCAIILATDVFGYKLPNIRLIADQFAAQGYLCVVPDYFDGAPVSMQVLEASESVWDADSLLGRLAALAKIPLVLLYMGYWYWWHPVQHAVSVVAALATHLKQHQGITKVGVQGYCYGGKVGIVMAAKPDCVEAVCIAHPGLIKVPEDIQAVEVPMLFICASWDEWFTEKARATAMQLLHDKSPGLGTFILYPGTRHGFAVRGNKRDPAVNAARKDALKQGLMFFNRTLIGKQSEVRPGAEGNTTKGSGGIRLGLAPAGDN